ncbi:cyclic nucleotide-binding domain-containing protein [Emticicia sp. ODNR4P]|nr:cyclic nucleotide-binding domain-containing protein [Emticicia sp. ODNR4P]
MHESLLQYLHQMLDHPLSEDEIGLIRETFVLKKIRKHKLFLEEGAVCKLAGFIVKGALKQYSVDETGKENILNLYIENWWVGDRESFMNNTPSPYFIEAFEDTEVLIISKEVYIERLQNQGFIRELSQKLSTNQAFKLLKRVHSSKTLSAEERLSELEKTYPEFLQRFPQHIVASYLGMTKETLSRIRNNFAKNR